MLKTEPLVITQMHFINHRRGKDEIEFVSKLSADRNSTVVTAVFPCSSAAASVRSSCTAAMIHQDSWAEGHASSVMQDREENKLQKKYLHLSFSSQIKKGAFIVAEENPLNVFASFTSWFQLQNFPNVFDAGSQLCFQT